MTIGEIGGTFMVVTVVYTERSEAMEYYGYQKNT